jgi:signal transduction histidine kinase
LTGEKLLDLAESVLASSDGLLWMASSSNGFYALTPRRISVETVEDPEAKRTANLIGGLVETAPGEFTVGTQGRGFYLWRDGVTERVEDTADRSRSQLVNALLRARDGSVWAGSSRGLLQFQNGQRVPASEFNSIGESVWEICQDYQGGFWVGTGSGVLWYFGIGAPQRHAYGSRGIPIKGLVQQPDGTLWIGTRGAGLFSLKDEVSRHFGREDGLPGDMIRALYVDRKGTLWIGTSGGGLTAYSQGRFTTVASQNGLPDDTVSQMVLDDDDRLWVGTNRGLAILNSGEVNRIRQGNPGELHPLIISRADGLLSEEFVIVPPVRMRDGRFAFATTQGFAIVRSGDFRADDRTPPVLVDRVLVNGRALESPGTKLSLPAGVERIQFDFTAPDFTAPRRVRFRSRLAGLEKDWGNSSTQRSVEYRNLEPGTYRFELSATTGNGHWTHPPAAIEVTLAPHFWQTTWFRIAELLALVGAVALGVHFYERQQTRRRMEVLERRRAVDAERARIARDLHDDIGSTLTQVGLLSEMAQSELPLESGDASEHINEIFTTVQTVTRSLDEIVWAVNPKEDTMESFVAFLGTFVQNYARTAGLHIRIDVPANLPATTLPSAIRHHLYLAVKEVLHNTVKHAAASEIRLRLLLEDASFRLLIEDNGCGFEPGPTSAGADGLINLERRLEQIGGNCTRRTAPGAGTAVEMVVPLPPQ